jgi:hypothetical protein
MRTVKKNAVFGRYPCCDMVNTAIRFIANGKPEYAIEELYQAIQKADGYIHEDLIDVVNEAHKQVWSELHGYDY